MLEYVSNASAYHFIGMLNVSLDEPSTKNTSALKPVKRTKTLLAKKRSIKSD
jgi:hypothetical protein